MDPLERVFRDERARVVGTLSRRLGDLQLAEDAVSEAFAAAAVTWPSTGVPDRPGAWLTTTAWRKAVDVLRRERSSPGPDVDGVLHDDVEPVLHEDEDLLQLLLTCCHPALAPEARVALTLRHVAGLGVREITAAFLVAEQTMAKRLVRARVKLRDSGVAFTVPDGPRLRERRESVRTVVYLVFTEGHLNSGEGPPVRAELCDEAVWLARQVHRLVPGDPENTGLLALLLLLHARTPARQDGGRLLPLAEQDPASWDRDAIAEGRALLAGTVTGGGALGRFQVEAAIAALHATAARGRDVPWPRIADLFGVLSRLAPSPVVTVNRAVAVGRADGPEAALVLLPPVLDDPRLSGYAPMHAAHGDLLERAGRTADAARAWALAARCSRNPAQRSESSRRAGLLGGG